MKKLLILTLIVFSCSKQEEYSFPSWMNPLMKSWIIEHSKEYKGWKSIKWNKDLLPILNYNTDQNTNKLGITLAKELNSRFLNTSDNGNPFYDTGIIVHGLDENDIQGNLFHPKNEHTATSFIRKDMVEIADNRMIWNRSFQEWTIGMPTAGVIYSFRKNPSDYMFFCTFPIDANSNARKLGCDRDKYDEDIFIDDLNEVKEAWDKKQSINTCTLNNIKTKEDFLKFVKKGHFPCSLSDHKEDFALFMDLYKNIPYPSHMRDKVLDSYTEFTLRYEKTNYTNIVSAIFYMTGTKDDYYATPQGNLKIYNIHLGEAQKQQKKLWDSKHIFKPILEIDMDHLQIGEPPIFYHPEDQLINYNNGEQQ